MIIEDYLQCKEYENQGAHVDGFVAFQHPSTNLYYFSMVDADGKVLLKSEGYTTEAARDNGIDSVKRNREIDARYKVNQYEGGKYYLSLKAGNHQEIARSCGFDSEADAREIMEFATLRKVRGGAALRMAAASGSTHDDYLHCDDYKGHADANDDGFVKFKSAKSGLNYFAMNDKSGDLVFRSEGYPNEAVRDNGIASVIKNRDIRERYKVIEVEGQHFVALFAGNHKEIARSCPFASAAAAAAWVNTDHNYPYGAIAAALGLGAVAAMPAGTAKVVTEKLAAAVAAPPVAPADKDDDYLACEAYQGHTPVDSNGIARFAKDGEQYFVWYDKDGNVLLRSEGFTDINKMASELAAVLRFRHDEARYETIERSGYRMRILKDLNGREVGRSCLKKIIVAAAVPPVVVAPPVVIPPVAAAIPVVGAALAAAALAGNIPMPEPPIVKVVPPVVVPPIAAAAPAIAEGGIRWWWVLPLLLLAAALLWFLFKGCNKETTAAVVPAVSDTVKRTAVMVDTTKKVAAKAAEPTTTIDGIKVRPIYYDFNKSDLRTASNTELDNLAAILAKHPEYNATIKANTDAIGNAAYNKALSQRRAKAAIAFLKTKGVKATRLKVETLGKAAPVAKNALNGKDSEEGRQLNRRVDLIVTDKTGKSVGINEAVVVPAELKK